MSMDTGQSDTLCSQSDTQATDEVAHPRLMVLLNISPTHLYQLSMDGLASLPQTWHYKKSLSYHPNSEVISSFEFCL